jgi:hypothetical protein
MSARLKTYRICCFDPVHNILSAELFESESDEAAIEKAEAMGFSKCELWEGRRLVAELDGGERRNVARQQRPFPFGNSPAALGTSVA